MNIFKKKENKSELYSDYPTKEEFLKNIEDIQNSELNSDRFKSTYSFLANKYWNRSNIELENELFKIIESIGNEDALLNKSNDYKKSVRSVKFQIMKDFINSLTDEQINSNIYLKCANEFMNMSNDVCSNIINELYNRFNNISESNTYTLELPIPKSTSDLIPNYINRTIGIKYYKPQDYRIEFIPLLEPKYQYVYSDNNELAYKIGRLSEIIYFLKLNEITHNLPQINCYSFQVYHPGTNDSLIASFSVKVKDNFQTYQEDIVPDAEFIQTTVNNFKKLIDMGLIDISVLDNKNTQYVLKRTYKE